MKRLRVMVLLLCGCATAPRAPEPAKPNQTTASEDAPLVQSYVQQQQSLLDELEHPSAAGHKPECPHLCELVENICALSGRICSVAARHEGEDEMKRACDDGLDRCSRARAEAAAAPCSCGG